MKANQILLCAVAILAAATQTQASTLYGATSAGGPGELWVIDQTTGNAMQDVGPLNDALANNYAVTGLAFDPVNGLLYGSTGGHSGTDLLTIDPATALVTVVGSYNATGAGTMADLAFDSAGNLYGISSSGGANLYTINLATGQATQVGLSGVSGTSGGGLAISPAGIFYGTPTTSRFGTYDPNTGAYNNITNPFKPAGPSASYASLAFDGNTLYGMDLGLPTHLVTIDSSGVVTDIGPSVASIDAIAFTVEPIPEPTSAALLLAGGVMARIASRRGKK